MAARGQLMVAPGSGGWEAWPLLSIVAGVMAFASAAYSDGVQAPRPDRLSRAGTASPRPQRRPPPSRPVRPRGNPPFTSRGHPRNTRHGASERHAQPARPRHTMIHRPRVDPLLELHVIITRQLPLAQRFPE